jgi:hypothetical protein
MVGNGEIFAGFNPDYFNLQMFTSAARLVSQRLSGVWIACDSWSLKPHCIRCSHFKVDDVSALEAISKLPVRIVEDNVTASLH